MSERIPVDSTWGRWTVIRRASPARRYGEAYVRARVYVRCVCGLEQATFESDLRSGKTTGCRSRSCCTHWRIAEELRARASDAPALERAALERAAEFIVEVVALGRVARFAGE